MSEYERCETPGMVLKDGAEVEAHGECDELAAKIEELEWEVVELQFSNDLPCPECEERSVDCGQLDDQAYRIKYAPNRETAIQETKQLIGMVCSDASWVPGVLE